jgi:hypothetical protein
MKYLILAICLGMFGCAGFQKAEILAKNTREVLLIDKCIEGVHQQVDNVLEVQNILHVGELERRITSINNVCFCTSATAISYRNNAIDMLNLFKEFRYALSLATMDDTVDPNPKTIEYINSLGRKMATLSNNFISKENALRAEQRSLLMREF